MLWDDKLGYLFEKFVAKFKNLIFKIKKFRVCTLGITLSYWYASFLLTDHEFSSLIVTFIIQLSVL